MSDVKEIEVQDVQPVAVGKIINKKPSLEIKMVGNRASHFYFQRVLKILRSLGKYR